MSFKYTLVNGDLVEADAPILPANNNDYFYGYSVYESIKVDRGIPFFLEEHLERLKDSAAKLSMDTPFSLDTIRAYITKLFRAEQPDKAMFKIWLFGGESPLVMMFFRPLPIRTPQQYSDGVPVISYPGHRFMPEIKSNCLLLSYLGLQKAHESGADEALLLNEGDVLLEGATTNFYAVREGKTLVTAPTSEVLPGVTRAHIIEIAKDLNIPVEYQPITLGEVKNGIYSGCMISSTTRNIMPVSRINDISLPRDPMTDRIYKKLVEMEEQEFLRGFPL